MKKAKPQDIVYQYVKDQIVGKSMFPGNRIIEDDIIRETGHQPHLHPSGAAAAEI